MTMTMSLRTPHPSQDHRRASLPHLSIHNSNNIANGPSSPSPFTSSPRLRTKNRFLTEEERAAFIVASSTRRPSIHQHFSSPTLSSPPSASYSSSYSSSSSSISSTASSPGGTMNSAVGPFSNNCTNDASNNNNIGGVAHSTVISPILTPFQWTSDIRQYIMTDIGPQPSNSEMPTLRSHSHLARQRSCSKISPVCITGTSNNSNSGINGTISGPGSAPAMSVSDYNNTNTLLSSGGPSFVRRASLTDLCTIPQDEVLPPMDVPLEKRFAHEEWDDED